MQLSSDLSHRFTQSLALLKVSVSQLLVIGSCGETITYHNFTLEKTLSALATSPTIQQAV